MFQVCIVTSTSRCKDVKTFLEARGWLDGSIARDSGEAILPTNLQVSACADEPADVLGGWDKRLPVIQDAFGADIRFVKRQRLSQAERLPATSPLLKTLQSYRHLPDELLQNLPGFERYENYLLFATGAFQSPIWQDFLQDAPDFGFKLAKAFDVTHIAVRNPIQRDDRIRKPRIEPFHGIFGFNEVPLSDSLFWARTNITVKSSEGCCAKIHYTWAPAQTMYSRGNLCEKERIAHLPDLKGKVVVDLYAGIGYWVFPYLFAGAKQVIACDINPYSLEGLRRSAALNKATATTLPTAETPVPTSEQLVILPFDNRLCEDTLAGLADIVSLGLLPDAKDGFAIAIKALKAEGGILRIHEEVAIPAGDKQAKQASRLHWANDVAGTLVSYAMMKHHYSAKVQGVFRIKTLGKELEHLVADICLSAA